MWDYLKYDLFIYGLSSFHIICLEFLKNSIINPKENVSLPISFFKDWRHILYGSLVDLSGSLNVIGLLFKSCIVKPQIVVVYLTLTLLLFQYLLFKVMSSLGEDNILHFFSATILFLELQKLLIQSICSFLWEIIQSIFVQNLSSLVFMISNFKFSELDKEVLIKCLWTQFR